jgi:hypothetical protein
MSSRFDMVPMHNATSISLKASSSLSVEITSEFNKRIQTDIIRTIDTFESIIEHSPLTRGKLISSISIVTPSSTLIIDVLSNK